MNVSVSRTGLKKLIKNFDETVSVFNKKKPSTAYNDDTVTIAIESAVEHPRSSLPHRVIEINVSHTLLPTIYNANRIYPCKLRFRYRTLEHIEPNLFYQNGMCCLVMKQLFDKWYCFLTKL